VFAVLSDNETLRKTLLILTDDRVN